jgi:hypothetical protein
VRDYILLFTITNMLVSTVTSSMPLLGSGFQRLTFSFLWVLELSPCLSYKLLTTTEPQQFTKFKVIGMLLPTVRWPVCLGVKPHMELKARFCYCQFRVCWCGAPSLARGWACRLHLLLALAIAVILRSESRGTHDNILLPQIRDSPNLEDQVPQEGDGPVITPGTGFPFRRLLRLAGLRWRYSKPPPHCLHFAKFHS